VVLWQVSRPLSLPFTYLSEVLLRSTDTIFGMIPVVTIFVVGAEAVAPTVGHGSRFAVRETPLVFYTVLL